MQLRHADSGASGRSLREILLPNAVQRAFIGIVRQIDLHVDDVLHRQAGALHNSLYVLEALPELAVFVFRNLLLGIGSSHARHIEELAGENTGAVWAGG